MSAVIPDSKVTVIDFKVMYQTFCHKVYRIAIRITRDSHLAEDTVQETFIKAYNNLDAIIELDKVEAWLSTIASRTAIDVIRKEKRTGIILPVEDMQYVQHDLTPAHYDEMDKSVEQHWLQEEIDQLKPFLKDVFLLKYKEGYKEEEIAEKLRLAKGTVKSRLYRARQQLRTRITKKIVGLRN